MRSSLRSFFMRGNMAAKISAPVGPILWVPPQLQSPPGENSVVPNQIKIGGLPSTLKETARTDLARGK